MKISAFAVMCLNWIESAVARLGRENIEYFGPKKFSFVHVNKISNKVKNVGRMDWDK